MEDVVSFEVAKLCEEKGIFIHTLSFYDLENKDLHNSRVGKLLSYDCSSLNPAYYKRNEIIAAPSQSILQKYLREKHNIQIFIAPLGDNLVQYIPIIPYCYSKKELPHLGLFSSYEEALEEGLKVALQMI